MIRQFRLDDYQAVVDLWQAAGLLISRSDQLVEIEKKLQRDPDLFLVAEEENTLSGVVMGAYDGRRGWVYHLAIHPSYQRRGIGSQLLAELEERFKAKGCSKINLLIEPENQGVQRFYEAHQYRADELIFMEKWLE